MWAGRMRGQRGVQVAGGVRVRGGLERRRVRRVHPAARMRARTLQQALRVHRLRPGMVWTTVQSA